MEIAHPSLKTDIFLIDPKCTIFGHPKILNLFGTIVYGNPEDIF